MAAAAVLAAQSPTGALSHEVRWHALATWALAEASLSRPDDDWLRVGADRAVQFLVDTLSANAGGELLARTLDTPTKQWCLQLLDVLSRPSSVGPSSLVHHLNGLGIEEGQPPGRIGETLDRLVRALPRGYLERLRSQNQSKQTL